MKKIYDLKTRRALVYIEVAGPHVRFRDIKTLLIEIQKDFNSNTPDIHIHYFAFPMYNFTGFGVSISIDEKPKKYRVVDSWFYSEKLIQS